MATPRPSLDLWAVLSESKRIINAHSRHFLALSVLFLLPLSFSLSVYPTLDRLLAQSHTRNVETHLSSLLPQQEDPVIPARTLFLALLYTLFVFIFSTLAVGSITYSVFHGFYGRPVKLISAMTSSFSSFWRLLATSVVSEIIVSGVLLVFGLFLLSVIKGIEIMGFQADYSSPYFVSFFVVLSIVLALILVYLQVNWALSSVIVVVESSWGYEPLKRSKSLIKGMRGVASSLLVFIGFFAGILLWSSSKYAAGLVNAADEWKSWASVLDIVLTSTFMTLTMIYSIASSAVLYMYCKASHGELAGEIAEEFAREYVSLPFDDGKVPHVVSIAYT